MEIKNRKILLLALLSIALIFSFILPASAAGVSAAMLRPNEHSISDVARVSSRFASVMALNTPQGKATPMVAAGLEGQLVPWNLILGEEIVIVPPEHCILAISSTAGGSVTTPGEGTFYYERGTVVNLVAEPQEGCRFVNWAGDVYAIADVNAAATTITIWNDSSVTAKFVCAEAGNLGIKAGDWIKVQYKITGWPAGQPYPEWLKVEFLSVEGTSANVRVTLHMSDGTEQSDTVPVDPAEGGGQAFGLSGFVIPANLTTGDSVYITGYGDVAIEGETTRTYAGARRTVVYASFSESIPYQGEVQLTYYWDKLTGVMVEGSTTFGGMTATARVTETNMWEATTTSMPWWLWII